MYLIKAVVNINYNGNAGIDEHKPFAVFVKYKNKTVVCMKFIVTPKKVFSVCCGYYLITIALPTLIRICISIFFQTKLSIYHLIRSSKHAHSDLHASC